MSETQVPDWLTIGGPVATLTRIYGAGGGPQRIRFSRVTKIGKRDVILEDGQRFNVNRLERSDGSTWSGSTTILTSREDPAITKAQQEIRDRNQRSAAQTACDKFLRGQITAFDAILALAPLTGCAEQIAALDTPPATAAERGGENAGEGL